MRSPAFKFVLPVVTSSVPNRCNLPLLWRFRHVDDFAHHAVPWLLLTDQIVRCKSLLYPLFQHSKPATFSPTHETNYLSIIDCLRSEKFFSKWCGAGQKILMPFGTNKIWKHFLLKIQKLSGSSFNCCKLSSSTGFSFVNIDLTFAHLPLCPHRPFLWHWHFPLPVSY